MRKSRPIASLLYLVSCIAAGVLLGACSSLDFSLPSKKVEYKSAGKLPPLDIPPDLTRPSADDRYNVPDARRGTATASGLDREWRQAAAAPASSGVLPEQSDARIERAGTQRWLVVKGDPAQVWPRVKDFWQEQGLIVNVEVPEAGVMETDWAENRPRVAEGGIRGIFGKVLDTVYSTAERDKFRTRLERGAENGTTEIYVSHRGMVEVYASEGRDRTVWQPRAASPELEAEFLRRLMVRFGVQEAKAKSDLATASAPVRARITKTQDGSGKLAVADEFDRAWRRVGLALDRVGFTVEDRDRSKGLYFVRYVDPEADNNSKKETGILSKLAFWRGDDKKNTNEQYRIMVKDISGGSEVNVLNKEGATDTSATANRILALLFEQLK